MDFLGDMFNYFFGSDVRSVPYLRVLSNQTKILTVITTEPIPSGRGRKILPNPVEIFCKDNGLNFQYFDKNAKYLDMTRGLCVSFGRIFSENFLQNNNAIYNIHLSLLPSYKGPSPVESIILNNEDTAGLTVFKIKKEIDAGDIVYQDSFKVDSSTYASDIYNNCVQSFQANIGVIIDANEKIVIKSPTVDSTTKKFKKVDFSLDGKTLTEAKKIIRAFDVMGPAFITHKQQFFKIHKYTDEEHDYPIELTDGKLYPSLITPEGKKMMSINDYMRGNL